MKKTLCVILCLVMVLCLMPMATFAATDHLQGEQGIGFAFADIASPAAGEKPSYDANYGGRGYILDSGNNNANYYNNGVGWYDVTEGKNVPTSGVFEAGHEYKVMIFFSAEEGYAFNADVSIQINGIDATVDYISETIVVGELTFPRLPSEELPIKNPFSDVTESDYFYDAVLWAVDNDITTGTGPITFSPNANCTRAQAVTFLWRTTGCPEPAAIDNPFTDVDPSAYYYKAVLWAVGSDITTGTSATTFSPDASCTRAQIVTFIWRASGQQEVSSGNPFADVNSGDYYYNAVLWAVDRGITTGLSATSFGPDAICTRAQIVTFLYRFIGG